MGDGVRAAIVIASLGPLACGGRAIGASETGTDAGPSDETGETGEPLSEQCEAALDPDTYADGPVLTPAPVLATAACPALAGPIAIDLPAPVLVTGVLEVDGQPVPGEIELLGRADEGSVRRYVGGDGSFTAELLPGRYDVIAWPGHRDISPRIVALEDVDLSRPSALVIDVPAPVELAGTMTMDGEPAPDPFGYLRIRKVGTNDYALVHMLDGSFALDVTPGSYQVDYLWCDYSNPLPNAPNPCGDWDGPPIPPDAARIGPQQTSASVSLIEVAEATITTIDVSTARLTGTVELDGAAPEQPVELVSYWIDEGVFPVNTVAADGSFDVRLVRGAYDMRLSPDGGSVPELPLLDADTQIEISRTSTLVSAALPDTLPLADTDLMLQLIRLDAHHETTLFTDPGELGITAPLWAGPREIWFGATYCWPDLAEGGGWMRTMLSAQTELDGPTELDLDVPVAAVHVDLVELGEHPIRRDYDGTIELRLEPEDTPPTGELRLLRPAGESSLDAHGYVSAGRYQVSYAGSRFGSVDLVDGATLRLHLATRLVDVELTCAGQAVELDGFASGLKIRNPETHAELDYEPDDPGYRTFAPGRYELIYSGRSHELDGVPDNGRAVIGCVTIEG